MASFYYGIINLDYNKETDSLVIYIGGLRHTPEEAKEVLDSSDLPNELNTKYLTMVLGYIQNPTGDFWEYISPFYTNLPRPKSLRDEERTDKAKEFLSEIEKLCKKYGYAIGHEDTQGGFELLPYEEDTAYWIQCATKVVYK